MRNVYSKDLEDQFYAYIRANHPEYADLTKREIENASNSSFEDFSLQIKNGKFVNYRFKYIGTFRFHKGRMEHFIKGVISKYESGKYPHYKSLVEVLKGYVKRYI